MPKISIIIPTYNCSDCIADALNSILKQDMEDYEIIVVDDGSKDNTNTIMTSYMRNFPEKIKYFYQENQGVSSARNKGIKESKGEYIVFLDADDLILPGSLKMRNAFLDRNRSVDLVFTDYYMDNQSTAVLEAVKFKDFFKYSFDSEVEDFISNSAFFPNYLAFSPHPVWIGTVMMRKKIIDTIGLFRIDFLNAQDLEFIIRIIRKFKVGYIDKPLSSYRHSLSQNSKKFERFYSYMIKLYGELKAENINNAINKILRKNISNAYYDFGYCYKKNSSLDKSKECLIRSIVNNPFQVRSYKTFIGTILPIKFSKNNLCQKFQ